MKTQNKKATMTIEQAKTLPGASIQAHMIRRIACDASVRDGRIRHLGAAIRLSIRNGVAREALRFAKQDAASHSLYSQSGDMSILSGRSGEYLRDRWVHIGDGIADLVRRGMSVDDARRISRIMMRSESCSAAVAEPLPGEMDITPETRMEETLWGWATQRATELGVSVEHVRRWHHWRKAIIAAAGHRRPGRRTARFFAAADKIAQREREAQRLAIIAGMGPHDRALAESVAAVLPRAELARGWMVSGVTLTTSHSFSIRCPDWVQRLASIGITCHGGGVMQLSSASQRISGAPIGAATWEASRASNPILRSYDRCAA